MGLTWRKTRGQAVQSAERRAQSAEHGNWCPGRLKLGQAESHGHRQRSDSRTSVHKVWQHQSQAALHSTGQAVGSPNEW